MEFISTDVLVIGSGLAGLMAAGETQRLGLQTVLLGKFAVGRGSNSSIANGMFSTANPRFPKEEHLRVTLEAGRGLNRVSLVETLVDHGPEAMGCLRGHGVPLVETAMGYGVGRPEASRELPGMILIRALLERFHGGSVRFMPGFSVFDLVIEEGSVRGAFGFSRDGKPFLIQSRAVILATGGAGAIYQRNDNQRGIRGDGYALALRAGLPLYDMEFVQFYPIVLAEPRLSTFLLYPPYPRGARLCDQRDEDLIKPCGASEDLNHAVIAERDRLSVSLYEFSQKGDVYLDLTRVSEEEWGRFPLNFLERSAFPFRERPFLVAPAVHFFMGGLEIDGAGRTALPGLFAAGEVTWGIHGANRLGGNALTECAVFGNLAGRSAAEWARSNGEKGECFLPLSEKRMKRWEKKAGESLKKRKGGGESIRELMRELRAVAWKHGGPIRDRDSLNQGLHRLSELEKRAAETHPVSFHEIPRKREMENMVLLLKAILQGSLLRQETRGAFCRRDFPGQDDLNWLKHSVYRLKEGELEVAVRPSSLTEPAGTR